MFIGLKPKLAAVAQPIAQIAASVPAPALFPIVLLLLIRAGGGLGISAMVVTINRLVWRRLYTLASTKFKLEFT